MTLPELDRQIKLHLSVLNIKEKLAILGVLKAFTEEYDCWKDPIFLKEMDRRIKDIESGKDKGVTLEQFKKRMARKLNKKNLMPDDELLEKHKGDVLFKQKVKKANETLKKVDLPKTKKAKKASS